MRASRPCLACKRAGTGWEACQDSGPATNAVWVTHTPAQPLAAAARPSTHRWCLHVARRIATAAGNSTRPAWPAKLAPQASGFPFPPARCQRQAAAAAAQLAYLHYIRAGGGHAAVAKPPRQICHRVACAMGGALQLVSTVYPAAAGTAAAGATSSGRCDLHFSMRGPVLWQAKVDSRLARPAPGTPNTPTGPPRAACAWAMSGCPSAAGRGRGGGKGAGVSIAHKQQAGGCGAPLGGCAEQCALVCAQSHT